ncbi:hypothetical protein PR048_025888, partial [Dryococelus australis]
MEQRRNARARETGDPRESPPTSGIVRQDSHVRKSGSDPAGNRTRFSYVSIFGKSLLREQRSPVYTALLREQRSPVYTALLREQRRPVYTALLREQRSPVYTALLREQRSPVYTALLREQRSPVYTDLLREQRSPVYTALLREQRSPVYTALLREQRSPVYTALLREQRSPVYTALLREQRSPVCTALLREQRSPVCTALLREQRSPVCTALLREQRSPVCTALLREQRNPTIYVARPELEDRTPRTVISKFVTIRGCVVVRLLTSHLDEPVSIPGGVAPEFSHVGIVPDDAAGRRVFSEIPHSPRPLIPALLQSRLASPSSALNTSMFPSAIQISPHSIPLDVCHVYS